MIHLFNKIHIKGDHQVKFERDRIVISPTYGSVGVIGDTFSTVVNDRPAGKIFYSTNTYGELISKHFNGDENAFFAFLVNYDPTKRLTLYVDLPTMFYIVTKFYKTIMPNLSVELFVKLIKLIFLRINYIFGVGFLPFLKLPATIAQEYRVASMNILDDIDQIIQQWNTTTPWSMTRAMKDKVAKGISVEFQLATYFAKQQWMYRAQFEQKTLRMVRKQLIHDFILDIKHTILASFVNLKVLEPTANFDPFVNTLDDFIAQFPQYKFLTDNNFSPENIDYVYRTYNIGSLGEIAAKIDTFFLYDVDPRIIKLLINNLTFDKLVEIDMMTTGHYCYNIGEYQESINSYMIDFIIDMKKTNQQDVLQQLAIG